MPFKSEKQRRFLWAEHPEIAKEWAHKYPDSNKNLPMYANQDQPKKPASPKPETKAASIHISELVNRYVNNCKLSHITDTNTSISKTDKTADSKQERVDIPHSSQPVYAGEERNKGQIDSEIPTGMNVGQSCEQKPKNAINDLLTKLSVVLSPHIEQTMENLEAEREGRVPRRIPRNRGVKQYPCGGINIMPPMGMAQNQPQQAQPQQNNQYPGRPVGGGSNPQFNPINSFGAISMTGQINGNAAFGAKNSPDSSKLSCFIPAAINRDKHACRSEILGKIMSIDANEEDVAYWEEEYSDELAGYRKAAKDNKTTPCSCGCGDTISTCKCASSCSCRKPGGSCYKPAKEKDADMIKYSLEDTLKLARCWAGYEPVPGKKPYSNDSCRPVGSGKKKKKKEESKSEKEAGTPAWQRSEGKNEAGGLNEKGRKSYEREHGGNLKAPVTQKNPKGEAKKRQNSFCSRMCGMKRVNTGAKTKSDPDSRINKSLRKWNCKCSSAMTFGVNVGAGTEKQANPLALAARVAKPGWAAVQAALRASKGALPTAAKATARTATTADNLLPTVGSKAYQAIQGAVNNLYGHPAAKYVAEHTGKGFAGLYDAAKGMATMGDDAIASAIGPRFRELQNNAIGAQRMAAGHLKVPRPKPVGFSDVNPQDWKALTDSWDAQDAIRRTLGM